MRKLMGYLTVEEEIVEILEDKWNNDVK